MGKKCPHCEEWTYEMDCKKELVNYKDVQEETKALIEEMHKSYHYPELKLTKYQFDLIEKLIKKHFDLEGKNE